MKHLPWLKTILLAGGLISIGPATLELVRPSYYDPRNLLDYAAVIGTTLAYLFLGAALWGLFR